MELSIVDQTKQETQQVIDNILDERLNGPKALSEPLFLEYKPRDGGPSKYIKIIDCKHDPFEPERHKQVSAPEPVVDIGVPILKRDYNMTAQEEQSWKIPRVISSWKNPNYEMSRLDKRIANDPRSKRRKPKLGQGIFGLVEALDRAESEVRASQELEELQQQQEKEEKSAQFDARLYAKARPASTAPFHGPLFAAQAVREMYVPKGNKDIEFEKE